ncbi:CDP-diacylglycerol---serine O-phosphatidyltransferase [uncultured bacterium]|nr:CDP-diacylglycerol---serine O-phosphatidyltransferase [uncultured bacterium]
MNSPGKRIIKSVPSIFTFANMVGGFLAIVYASQGDYSLAGWILVAAAAFDAVDGIAARALKATSTFGVELDSLADVVSFGLAPAYIIYASHLNQTVEFAFVAPILYLVAAGYRLARFNAELIGYDKEFFYGLPAPLAAMTVTFFIIAYPDKNDMPQQIRAFIIPGLFIISFLMVSRIRFETLPKFSIYGIKEKPWHFVFLALSLLVIFLFGERSLIYIFVFVILLSIFKYVMNLLSGKV